MSAVQKYVEKRSKRDKAFAMSFETGYTEFKIGVILCLAREEAGLTQGEVARPPYAKKFAISRMANYANDVPPFTSPRCAEAVDANLEINLVQG